MNGIALGEAGVLQARKIAQRFAAAEITAVHSSPRERAQQTAAPIAERAGCQTQIVEALDEIDVGQWTGRSFDELSSDARWQHWNNARLEARAPDGESMREVQHRIIAHIEQTRSTDPGGRIVLVSHSDVIKAAILHYLDLPLNAYGRIEIAPASISTLVVGDWGAKLTSLNEGCSP